jgi:hypothetical protein
MDSLAAVGLASFSVLQGLKGVLPALFSLQLLLMQDADGLVDDPALAAPQFCSYLRDYLFVLWA